MSIEKYIKRMSSAQKNLLLTSNVTKLLRLTFCDDEFQTLPEDILNEALIASKGFELVQTRKHREYIIDSLFSNELESLGYSSYEDAQKDLASSAEKFARKLSIDQRFLQRKPDETREHSVRVQPEFGSPVRSRGFLHAYQKRIKDDLLRSFWSESGINSRLCLMPTGAGKTTVALELMCDLARSNYVNQTSGNRKPFKFVWLVEGTHLADQSLLAMEEIWALRGDGPMELRRFFTPFDDSEQAFETESANPSGVFSTFSLVTSRLGDESMTRYFKECEILIVDEAHSAKAETYLDAINKYRSTNPNGQLLGLTATPYRSDDSIHGRLKDMFQRQWQISDDESQKVKSPIEWLIRNEYLSRLEVHQINELRASSNEFNYYKKLHEAIIDTCHLIQERQQNLIVFAESKAHAISLSLLLNYSGIRNGLIVGETPTTEREKMINDVKQPESSGVNVLVNHHILSKGLDIPGLNSIMVLGNTDNPALALQIIGRAMRGPKNGGNKSNTVYLTRDNFQFLKNTKFLESIIQS
jgi:superfamily II DNA or RNA helicase